MARRLVLAAGAGVRSGAAGAPAGALRPRLRQAPGRGASRRGGGARRSPLALDEPGDLAAGVSGRRRCRRSYGGDERAMRILWVKVGGLWPLNAGGRLRSFHIIAQLARQHRVTLLTTHGPRDDPEGLAARLANCEPGISVPCATPKRTSPWFALALLRSWLSPLPADLWKCLLPARACARARLTVAVSEADRTMVAAHAPKARVRAIPTGVDTSYFTPNGSHEAPGSVVLPGSMNWWPNEDSVVYFVEAILPRIRSEMPEVSLTVVGRNPSARVLQLAATAGVRVTGTVDDVRPYVAEASVGVVPLRVGGGTRIKIFELLAMGKAVVSTTVGAEGLPLISGTHCLRVDDPADFAAAIVALLRDPARRRALGSAGRRLVEERYSWSQVTREFEALCEEEVRRHAC